MRMAEFLRHPATGHVVRCSVMNFYRFNEDGKIVCDIAAELMIGIHRGIGLVC